MSYSLSIQYLAAVKADTWAEYPPFSLRKKGTLGLLHNSWKSRGKKQQRNAVPVIPGESCVGLFGCWVFNFKGFFLVQHLLDRQTWKHQQNSCLLHFVSTLLKQKSFVYMFCVNKQHCTYTHINNLQIMYFSSWNNLAKSQVLAISWARRVKIIHARFSEYWCQIVRY